MNPVCSWAGRFQLIAMLAVALLFSSGCASSPKTNLDKIRADWSGPETRGLTLPYYDKDVEAICDPPIGWKADPLKTSSSHIHQVWLSPTGASAYGVIYFKLPLPVGENLALSGFLDQMKDTEGDSTLIERHEDPKLPGIRFVADGGLYRIRVNFIVATWEGWAVYAGSLRGKPVVADELDLAVRAREHTYMGSLQK